MTEILDPFALPAAPAAPAAQAVISVDSAVKRFRLPDDRHPTLKHHLLHPVRSRSGTSLTALDGVSFDVRRGEFLAIVGRNGSGKSTLLRCMAGIYPLGSGEIRTSGRIAPFIELGVGFHPDLPARDNLLTSGILFGLSRREIRDRYSEILRFADVERFAGLKLKNFSSGMAVRLGFALTTHIEADILFFDEVIAIGDAAFKEKCFARFAELKGRGKTLVLVSHDMAAVRRLCDRAILLDRGAIVCEGDAETVADRYEAINRGAALHSVGPPVERAPRPAPASKPPRMARLKRTVAIAIRLAIVDFKLKYRDRGLSYAWGLARPLLFFAALDVVFTRIAHLNAGVHHYSLYLFTSLVLWTFFFDSTNRAVFSLVNHADVIRKVPLERAAIPLAVVLRSILDLATNAAAIAIFVAIAGLSPRPGWLELPLVVGLVAATALGVSLLVSSLYVTFRDVDHLWGVVSQILFYVTPIVYAASLVPAGLRRPMLELNPLATAFTQMRHAFVDASAPTAAQLAGGAAHLLIPVAIAAAILGAGAVVFSRTAAAAAENL